MSVVDMYINDEILADALEIHMSTQPYGPVVSLAR